MCPHGYHHNGFMVTPALGTQEVHRKYIYLVYLVKYITVIVVQMFNQIYNYTDLQ